MCLDLVQILHLTRCAPAQIAAPRIQGGLRYFLVIWPLFFQVMGIHRLDQAQLNLFNAEMMVCLIVEVLQSFHGK